MAHFWATCDNIGRVGFEPTRSCPRRILSPLRLPFRHRPKENQLPAYCTHTSSQQQLDNDAKMMQICLIQNLSNQDQLLTTPV